MTLSVFIGKIDPHRDGIPYIDMCPSESYDVCDPEYTIYPRKALRSGADDMRDFFDGLPDEIYINTISDPDEMVLIEAVIGAINALPDDIGNPCHNDRMKWLKFWCNRAVELYGDEAGIEFC